MFWLKPDKWHQWVSVWFVGTSHRLWDWSKKWRGRTHCWRHSRGEQAPGIAPSLLYPLIYWSPSRWNCGWKISSHLNTSEMIQLTLWSKTSWTSPVWAARRWGPLPWCCNCRRSGRAWSSEVTNYSKVFEWLEWLTICDHIIFVAIHYSWRHWPGGGGQHPVRHQHHHVNSEHQPTLPAGEQSGEQLQVPTSCKYETFG